MSLVESLLLDEILQARKRIYAIGDPTPLEMYEGVFPFTLFLKREDLSPIHAYKWRGAYNAMAALPADLLKAGMVTASAGNHAQGVALSARKLNAEARIYMPLSTPQMKQLEVERLGGTHVEICLKGDSYDDAYEAARADEQANHRTFIHPYDDYKVMGGQGTLADEIVMSGQGPFDIAYLQIGGGGMAAGVSFWLKKNYPEMEIVGVEGVYQAGMAAAFEAGHPVRLDYVDVFCDGTAVRTVGEKTFPVCRSCLDRIITVSNTEVSAAIQQLWKLARVIPEPSGAMGLAGLMQERDYLQGKRVLAIICGANMDFHQLGRIAREADVGAHRLRYFRVFIPEGPGEMLNLLSSFPRQINIAEFLYGKSDINQAAPVVGFEGPPEELAMLEQRFENSGVKVQEVTGEIEVEFRVIPFSANLVRFPVFLTLEFHERPGALAGFLKSIGEQASICYFNYTYSGERVGRALLGFEFDSPQQAEQFREQLPAIRGKGIREYREIPDEHILSLLK